MASSLMVAFMCNTGLTISSMFFLRPLATLSIYLTIPLTRGTAFFAFGRVGTFSSASSSSMSSSSSYWSSNSTKSFSIFLRSASPSLSACSPLTLRAPSSLPALNSSSSSSWTLVWSWISFLAYFQPQSSDSSTLV